MATGKMVVKTVGNAARHASFLCFMKDVLLIHGYENGKHEGYGK